MQKAGFLTTRLKSALCSIYVGVLLAIWFFLGGGGGGEVGCLCVKCNPTFLSNSLSQAVTTFSFESGCEKPVFAM